jgi:UV DNA damage endonuclease
MACNLHASEGMLRHLGYVAIALSIDAPTNRTCRLANATPARLRELIAANLGNLERVLAYNVSRDVSFYRISSDVIPFASHPVNRLAWWEEYGDVLVRLGEIVRRHAMRVSMHPGQFAVLNSLNPAVVTAAVKDVEWHSRFLDALRVADDAKIVIHIGSMAEGRDAAIARFSRTVAGLSERCRARLIIENDDRLFTADDALAASHETGLPVVFDWLHHRANPGRHHRRAGVKEILDACFSTWRERDGIPKVHLSSQVRGGRPGHHADWVRVGDVTAFLDVAPRRPFDAMLEAKRKDQALVRLRGELARLGIVESGRAGPSRPPRARRTARRAA